MRSALFIVAAPLIYLSCWLIFGNATERIFYWETLFYHDGKRRASSLLNAVPSDQEQLLGAGPEVTIDDTIGSHRINNTKSSTHEFPVKDERALSHSLRAASKRKRPSAILMLFRGDEGSTVLSEAMRNHPQVYSPTWMLEPVNKRNWKPGKFTLQKQLEAIRFLLRLPSNDRVFKRESEKLFTKKEYAIEVGNAEATYLKAKVCAEEKGSVGTWSKCIEEVLDNLMCGDADSTIDHLILPIRYGFNRVCSKYVHQNSELYKKLSQFQDQKSSVKFNISVSIRKNQLSQLEKTQVQYILNFIESVRLAQESCPGQQQRPKIHIYDYEAAKKVGMKQALGDLIVDLGLRNEEGDLDLGRFAERKPSNYCERIFDSGSQEVIQEREDRYNKWLNDMCGDDEEYLWCGDRRFLQGRDPEETR